MPTRPPIPGLNPDILVWARQRSGHDLQQVARRLDQDPQVIAAWEAGASGPTYVQLETLAYKVYKRPVALFFFPEPPVEEDPEHAFRTLPEFVLEDLAADTRFHIRDARAKQLALGELTGGRNPAKRKIFRSVEADMRSEPAAVAAEVRAFLAVTVDDQRRWRGVGAALTAWRELLEEGGVFVFKASFSQREVSGFCLDDREFPVIYLNNSVAKSRQIFTLFHELAHLLLGTNGITRRDTSYIAQLSGSDRRVEVFCNAFAGEFLAPREALLALLGGRRATDENVGRIARQLEVSREVILRRLLDLGRVSRQHYEAKAAEWTADYFDRLEKGGGGNWYNTRGAYLGRRFLGLAFQQLYRGAITRAELADLLGVKASNIAGLEERLLATSTG